MEINTFQNNPWVKKITTEIIKYFGLGVIKNTLYQTSWDITKNITRGECLVLKVHTRKQSQRINFLNIHIKKLGWGKGTRNEIHIEKKMEIMKIRSEIKEVEKVAEDQQEQKMVLGKD